MDVSYCAVAELPLITTLALERANKNCYEKGLWVINVQESFTYHRKTTEIENLDMYCLCHSTIIPFLLILILFVFTKLIAYRITA